MLYAVGTYIDLRYMNSENVPAKRTEVKSEHRLYSVGTRIIFLNMIDELSVLKITKPSIALRAS